ncbi:MAG TPA: hypothetical protein VHE55_03450 [Fimbriimonadaceae bacterium]|nr:hypothetical protein [Fimbriimonadaceae bacterium]
MLPPGRRLSQRPIEVRIASDATQFAIRRTQRHPAAHRPYRQMGFLEDFAFAAVFSRLVAVRPRVSKVRNTLVAVSDGRSQLWSLGFGGRRLVVDPALKTVRVVYRRFWFFRTSRRIEFDWIAEVIYGYRDWSTGWGAYREQDLFTVGLKLKNGEELILFRFFGEGDFVNNSVFPDWMFWDDFVIANYTRGPQERESLLFADLVSRMVGAPISNPDP